jgi:hypothetical protein
MTKRLVAPYDENEVALSTEKSAIKNPRIAKAYRQQTTPTLKVPEEFRTRNLCPRKQSIP